MSTYSYFLNTEKAPFDNALVRKALSIAIDREELCEEEGMGAKPATGLVPYGVHDAKTSKSFRKAGGKLLDTEGNIEQAKALLKEAGIKASDYSFTIATTRAEADVAIAEYVKEVWEELGFDVSIKKSATMLHQKNLYAGDFDVAALDYQALTTDAFSVLAPFARAYSGSVVKIGLDTDTTTPHITGFDNDEYNALIDEAFNTADKKERAKLLHEAEKLLLEESPVIPLHFNVYNYMKSSKLSGIKTSVFGYNILTNAKLSGYRSVLERLAEIEEAEK
jgi:dipeptide transport system substrate-binding protein